MFIGKKGEYASEHASIRGKPSAIMLCVDSEGGWYPVKMVVKRSGFTLLELAIIMIIAGIVMIGAPPVWLWLRTQGSGHAVDKLTADLQLARMTAIRKRTRCVLQLNTPGTNQYRNSVNGRINDLAAYRGGIHFLPQGPNGSDMAACVTFNQHGMSTSVAPRDLFVADRDNSVIYRIRVMAPGGISVHRWFGGRWQ